MVSMSRCPGCEPTDPTRRDLLAWLATGLSGMAMADLLGRDRLLAAAIPGDATDPPPHHPRRAARVVHIFLQGGLSQVDSFDHKPELIRRHGQPMPVAERPDAFFGKVGPLHRPHWEFRQRGQSGLWISELFPN